MYLYKAIGKTLCEEKRQLQNGSLQRIYFAPKALLMN